MYILIACLTLTLFYSIINFVKRKKGLKYLVTKQSDMHNILKTFFSRQTTSNKKPSQIMQRSESNYTNVVIIDDKAYWVADSIFYMSVVVDGRPDISQATPVDIYSMPKKELDKMLFILDNLGGGNNERGNSRNE